MIGLDLKPTKSQLGDVTIIGRGNLPQIFTRCSILYFKAIYLDCRTFKRKFNHHQVDPGFGRISQQILKVG